MPVEASESPTATDIVGGASCDVLLGLIAAGDRVAFDVLYAREISVVRGVAAQLLRDPFQAQEVAQDVMLEIWLKAGSFNATLGSGRSWIMRMTRCRAIDRIRSSQRTRDRDHAHHQDATRGERCVDVAAVVSAELDTQLVQTALLMLPALHREALVLAFYSPRSYPQIAAHLGVPLATLKTRIRDGLIKLRRTLDEDPGRAGVTPEIAA